MEPYISKLWELKDSSANSPQEADIQHQKGRLTARERVDLPFDTETFTEIAALVMPGYESYQGGEKSRHGDGIITGYALVNGRLHQLLAEMM